MCLIRSIPDRAIRSAILLAILHPEEIGVTLTDTFQIEPEQSTSAIVVHHPGAKYFVCVVAN